jgi:hypothetical protein
MMFSDGNLENGWDSNVSKIALSRNQHNNSVLTNLTFDTSNN